MAALADGAQRGRHRVRRRPFGHADDAVQARDSDGTWSFGQKRTIPEAGSRWAVNPDDVQAGLVCLDDGNKMLGEKLVPVSSADARPRGAARQGLPMAAAMGGQHEVSRRRRRRHRGRLQDRQPTAASRPSPDLIEAVRDRLNSGQHDGKVAPIVLLEKSGYPHANTARSGPAAHLVDWMPLDRAGTGACAGRRRRRRRRPSSRVAGVSANTPMFATDEPCAASPDFSDRLRSSSATEDPISRPPEPMPVVADNLDERDRMAFAIGEPPLSLACRRRDLDWDHAPHDLRAAFDRGATFAAWHATFDAAVWNYSTLGFPFLTPERVIDPMVQAGVTNLPTDLESASRALGGEGKQSDGKKLIRLFCIEGAAPSRSSRRVAALSCLCAPGRRGDARCLSPDAAVAARGMAAILGVRAHQSAWRRARHAVRPPRRGPRGRRRRRQRPPAGRTNRRGRHQGHAGARIATWLHDQLADAAMREVLTVGVPADDDDDDEDDAPNSA